jgi:hypothetical protein
MAVIRLGSGAFGFAAATLLASVVLGGSLAYAESTLGSTPIVLASGQRISLVDNSQPGVMIEIVAPKDGVLPLNDLLEAVSKKGISAALGYAKAGANTVVLDASGKLQLKASGGTIAPQALQLQDRANQITIAGGYITVDRGNIAIAAEQVTRPNAAGAAITSIGNLNANTANPLLALTGNASSALPATAASSTASSIPAITLSGAGNGIGPGIPVINTASPTLSGTIGTITLNSTQVTLGGNVSPGISSGPMAPSVQSGNAILPAGSIKQITITAGALPPPTFINPAGGGIAVLNSLSNPGTLSITGTLKGK